MINKSYGGMSQEQQCQDSHQRETNHKEIGQTSRSKIESELHKPHHNHFIYP